MRSCKFMPEGARARACSKITLQMHVQTSWPARKEIWPCAWLESLSAQLVTEGAATPYRGCMKADATAVSTRGCMKAGATALSECMLKELLHKLRHGCASERRPQVLQELLRSGALQAACQLMGRLPVARGAAAAGKNVGENGGGRAAWDAGVQRAPGISEALMTASCSVANVCGQVATAALNADESASGMASVAMAMLQVRPAG